MTVCGPISGGNSNASRSFAVFFSVMIATSTGPISPVVA